MKLLSDFVQENIVLILFLLTIIVVKSLQESYSVIKMTNKQISKMSGGDVNMLIKPLDPGTHDVIMENLKGMIILYTMVTIKNNIVAKQNESMNYVVSIDTPEAKELKETITIAIYNDLPEHLIAYLEYYFGNAFLQVYIETEIVQAIIEEAKRMPE